MPNKYDDRMPDSQIAAELHRIAPVIATRLTALDSGHTWTAPHELMHNDYPNTRLTLRRDDGLEFLIYTTGYDNRATCCLTLPNLPDGTPSGYRSGRLRDFLPAHIHSIYIPEKEAAVSLQRLFNDPARVAGEFHRRVIAPNAPFWPQVLEAVALRQAEVDKRDAMVRTILYRYPGATPYQNDAGSSRRIHMPHGPSLEVCYDGEVRTLMPVSGDLETVCKVVDILIAARKE